MRFYPGSRLDLVRQSLGRLAGAWSGIPAVCVGNGESRSGLDLAKLPVRGEAFVIGCNRIYQDLGYRLDAIVSMDETCARFVMEEARIQGPLIFRGCDLRNNNAQHLTPGTWAIGLPTMVQNIVSGSSGVVSVAVAIAAGCHPIYTLGHDLEPGFTQYLGEPGYNEANGPSEQKVNIWRGELQAMLREYTGHMFQVETENVPSAARISWDEFLDRFAMERVEVVK